MSEPTNQQTLTDPWPTPRPEGPVRGTVTLPGSKSLTNRALVLAALADAPGVVRRALRSRDTELMATALSTLGCEVDTSGDDWAVTPGAVRGRGTVDCGLAGTVMRFVPPVAALADGPVVFDGDPHARSRPMHEVLRGLRGLGVEIEDEGRGSLPFTVLGHGAVRGGEVTIDASASSQFISALLLAAPRYDEGVDVRHDGKPVPSLPHIDMTVQQLRLHGVEVDDSEANRWRVLPGPVRAVDVLVEPDLSNAGPFLAAALVTGGSVTVRDWPHQTTQAGDALREIVTLMGAKADLTDAGLTVTGDGVIHGVDVDLHDVGELTPVVAALCVLADSPSHLRGIAHIRGHETDRLAALATEFNGLGGHVTETDDGLTIRPAALHGGTFRTYADHRMAHAGVVLGLAVDGVRVEDVATTAKTFPGFADAWSRFVEGRSVPRYDEYDPESFDRPRRRTRPRTKDRPSYDDAVEGTVVTVDRGRLTCLVDGHTVMAVKARPLGRKGVVVGDKVRVVGDTSGTEDTLARIVGVEDRRTVLRRTADDSDPVERVIVANADQLVVVTALADPEPRPRLIDRALVAAYDAGLEPLLCLTKGDLADPETLLSIYRPLGVPYVVAGRDDDHTAIRERLTGKTSVLVGHSGVGKSTLVNALVPGTDRAIGHVNAVTGRGRHTSTSALMLPLPGEDGWIVDTPGIRSFGLAHVQPSTLINAFPDLAALTEPCPRGCTHGEGAPECGLDEAIADGRTEAERVHSFRRLLASREEGDDY